jgi:hypothetical protein
MRTAEVVCALVLLAGAAVVISEGLRLGIGWSSDGPEPGFFVFYLGIALGLCMLAVLAQQRTFPGLTRRGGPFLTPGGFAKVAKVAGPAAAMIALTHVVGLYVAGALYMGTYMRWIGRYRWLPLVALSVAVPVITFLIFEVWFLVPLPKGPLEAALGY